MWRAWARPTVMALLAVAASGASGGAYAERAACGGAADQSFGGVATVRAGNGVVFRTRGLAVDADGAPNSYRVDGKGLSFTCDGVVGIVDGKRITPKVDRANWQRICSEKWNEATRSGDYSSVSVFGFATDANGKPVVQGAGDPLPTEAFITTTSVTIPDTPEGTQRHYVDAVKIPYVVLPASFVRRFGVGPGDLAVVYRPRSRKVAFAAYGDGGDLGEASVRLHQDLGNDPLVTSGGVERAKRGIEDAVVTVVFPGVRTARALDAEAWRASISQVGQRTLAAWGGEARLQACTP
jgi:Fungal chitosanase of glycosyl hydrolase group 75